MEVQLIFLYQTCPSTLLISLIISSSFLQIPQDFIHRKSHGLSIKRVLLLPFQPECFFFYCFIVLVRISNKVLNKRMRRDILTSFPILEKNKKKVFHLTKNVSYKYLLDVLCQTEEVIFYFQFAVSFYYEWLWTFVSCIFYVY